MKSRGLLLGIATGVGFGYVAVRLVDVLFRVPQSPATGTAREYTSLRRSLTVSNSIRSLLEVTSFAYGPGGAALDALAARAPQWLQPAVFSTVALGLQQLIDAPVGYVEDWTVETSFRLTDQSAQAWWIDYMKGAGISIAIAGLLSTLGGWCIRRMPKTWPFAATLATAPLLLLANIVVPLYILPIFNKFEPLEGALEERLRALATQFDVGDAEILRMDMSRQTKKANAFVTGVFNTHRIVLGDTLIESFEPEEIEFVIAHELGHYVTRDTWRSIAIGQAAATLLFFTANALLRDEDRSRPLFMARLVAMMSLGATLLRPALLGFSRSREWAADRFALDATKNARAGADAFRRLRDQNKAEDDVPSWYEFLYSSHPSLGDRIAALDVR